MAITPGTWKCLSFSNGLFVFANNQNVGSPNLAIVNSTSKKFPSDSDSHWNWGIITSSCFNQIILQHSFYTETGTSKWLQRVSSSRNTSPYINLPTKCSGRLQIKKLVRRKDWLIDRHWGVRRTGESWPFGEGARSRYISPYNIQSSISTSLPTQTEGKKNNSVQSAR